MKKRLLATLLIAASTTLIASVTTTVAWFASNAKAFVDGLSITFVGNKDLNVATKIDGEYKNKLEKSDLMEVYEFRPVSSMKSYEWMNEKSEKPYFIDTPISGGEYPKTIRALSGFFSQELFLLSENNTRISIDVQNTTLTGDDEKNVKTIKTEKLEEKYPELTYEQIRQNLNDVEKSMRVSILVPDEEDYQYAILNVHKNEPVCFAGLVDTNNDGYYDYYKKNGEYYETVYGDVTNRDKLVYDESAGSEPVIKGTKHKEGVRVFNLEKSIANGAEIAYEQSSGFDTIQDDLVIHLEAKTPKRIVLSIFAEGWDKYNSNLLMYASFNLKLTLKSI